MMADREWHFRIEGCDVEVLGVINGLTSEVDLIRKELDTRRPRALALSLSEKHVEVLRKWMAEDDPPQPEYSEYDAFYSREMSRFGDVILPSPSHLFTIESASRLNLPLIALDMDDEKYADLYMEHVSPVSLFLDSIFRKRRLKKQLEGSAEEVVLALDEMAKHPRGIARLDDIREKHMAGVIADAAGKFQSLLAVVDYERSAGVMRFLPSAGSQS